MALALHNLDSNSKLPIVVEKYPNLIARNQSLPLQVMLPKNKPTSIAFIFIALSSSHAAEEISFNQDIKPILSDRCFKCHGPDAKNQKSEFRLDTRDHATADLGDGFFGIVPGNIEESDLHWRIWEDVEEDMMPPLDSNLSLSDDEELDRSGINF